MTGARSRSVWAAALLTVLVGTSAPAVLSSASTKPLADTVPAGARVLTWSPSPSVTAGVRTTVVVTAPSIIHEVRDLVNSLSVTRAVARVCPDDMMVPSTLSFAARPGAAPFTRVVFQLGGCPYARVYQNGSAISPTLGGARLARVYGLIEHLVDPRAHPVA